MLFSFFTLVLLVAAVSTALAASNCTITIASLSDSANASSCTTVNIIGFTVPAGQGLTLSLATGSTVNLCEPLSFAAESSTKTGLTSMLCLPDFQLAIYSSEMRVGQDPCSPSVECQSVECWMSTRLMPGHPGQAGRV